jgi:hypothetical protein
MLPIVHQFHCRVWVTVRCPSVPSPHLASCSLPITSTVALGRLFIAHHVHLRVSYAVRRLSASRSRLADCRLPISYTVVFGQPFVAHQLHRRVWQADRRSPFKRDVNEEGRSRSAPRARRLLPSQSFVEALTRNAPFVPARSAVQHPEGAPKRAHTPQRAHTPLTPQGSPAVRPASVRDQT